MADLTSKSPKITYKDLLQVSNSNSGIDGTIRTVEDGEGTESALKLSTDEVEINGNLVVGDPGTENAGININGVTYSALCKINDIGGAEPAQCVIHRHSTTLQALILGVRSKTNDETHAALANNDVAFSLLGGYWSVGHYDLCCSIDFVVPASGTVSETSSPGDIVFKTTANGSNIPTEAMRILSDTSIITASTVDGRAIATDGTKLDTIEESADVTDETNVLAALNNATIGDVTPTTADLVLFQDVTGSNAVKRATVAEIVALGGGGASIPPPSAVDPISSDFYYTGQSTDDFLDQDRQGLDDGRMRICKVTLSKELTLKDLSIVVQTAQGSRFVRFGMWESDGTNGLPGALVFDSGAVSLGTTGVQSVADTTVLDAGVYWIGSVSDGNLAKCWGQGARFFNLGIEYVTTSSPLTTWGFLQSVGTSYDHSIALGSLSSETWNISTSQNGCWFVMMRFTL